MDFIIWLMRTERAGEPWVAVFPAVQSQPLAQTPKAGENILNHR